MVLMFGISVSSAEGMSHLPIQNILSLCFGVKSKTPGLISSNNFVKKNCIGHRDNDLARCDSIFPLLRFQGL
jgi:hypothetical protein